MRTSLTTEFLSDPRGQRANAILRKCVHCGFCNATCPTYQILGDELDGPRGRIYQIKTILEGQTLGSETRQHLDLCLTCLNCETTCPSGVEYGTLLAIGRELIETRTRRPGWDSLKRHLIRETLAHPKRFAFLLALGRMVKPLTFGKLRQLIPIKQNMPAPSIRQHGRKMLLLEGCVQPSLSPAINTATCQVLDRLGITAIRETPAACCGALHCHTSATEAGLNFARQRIDAWWPYVESGIEAIISTASGCGIHIKHYGELLKDDRDYADKASKISELTKDIIEILHGEDIESFGVNSAQRVAFHPPCTLQHGQKITNQVESLLGRLGIECVTFNDSHLCCGAAGSYTLLQPTIAGQLKERKLDNIKQSQPDVIATANIGCLHHLGSGTRIPVKHWVELLVEQNPQPPGP